MDVGKVTNWFRNLRQSDRKRARQNGSTSAEEMDEDPDADVDADTTMDVDDDASTRMSMSRTATPSATSTSGVESVKVEALDEKPLHLHEPSPHFHAHPHGPSRSIYARMPLTHSQSELGSDEELPEAVTPSPDSSPPPPTVASTSSLALPLVHPHARETKASINRYALEYAQYESDKAAPELEGSGVKMEDALLLLSFHHGTVVH